ncbi:MAG: hypothetical protein ACI9K2_006425 [Myxococcota bacterium]|jgi:hypothetical protein
MPERLAVTGDATRFLALLEDFGHTTSDVTDRLILGAAEVAGGPTSGSAEMGVVRRAAAVWLFGQAGTGPVAQRGEPLAQDWALLFS